MKYVETVNAPQALGPYSQAVEVNGFVFCSGQIGIDPQSGELQEGIEIQTKQVLTNVQAVLEAAGSSVEKVVKTEIFLTNIKDFDVVNEVYESFFTTHKPARSTVEVSALPKGALVEIACIASK